MAIALTKHTQHEYVLQADREAAPALQTVWLFRPLFYALSMEVGAVFNAQPEAGLDPRQMAEVANRVLRFCLVGWRNWRDEAGAEIRPELEAETLAGQPLQVVPWRFLDLLTVADRTELWQAALQAQHLTKADALG